MGGTLGAALLLAFPACSDDHYDILTGAEGSNKTIWQNIESHPEELDSLGMILKQVRVYTKEEDTKRTMTYAELLNQAQSFTFWAPRNGTYNAKQYLDQIEEIKALREAGQTEKADRMEYNIGLLFAQNHMARFNYEAEQSQQNVRLFNGKLCSYNAGEGVFNAVKLDATMPTIPSSNGMLHVLDGKATFAYNIYDYMGDNEDIFQNVYGTLTDPEINKRTFNEAASTPGGMGEDGKMIYVDSVFYYNNELLNSCGAQIKNEDSLYVAVIPTDAAWTVAEQKTKKLFNYSTYYKYNYNPVNDDVEKAFTAEKTFSQHDRDSLVDYNTKRTIITSMYFSPSIFAQSFVEQYKKKDREEAKEMIANYAMYADSLISTNNSTFYNPVKGQLNPLFGDGHYVKASNGVIFPITEYKADPANTIMQKSSIDMLYDSNVGFYSVSGSMGKGTYTYLVEGDNWNKDIDISSLETKGYRYFSVPARQTSAMKVFFPLQSLMSGKYRIRIMLLPNRVDLNHRYLKENKETNEQEEIMQNTKFFAAVYDDEGNQIGEQSPDITVDDNEVKTYTLFESIEIPKCYYNLPSGVNKCYPLLKLEIPGKLKPYRPYLKTQPSGLSVVKIFVEPVGE